MKTKKIKTTKAHIGAAFGLAQCLAKAFGGKAVKTATGAAVVRKA